MGQNLCGMGEVFSSWTRPFYSSPLCLHNFSSFPWWLWSLTGPGVVFETLPENTLVKQNIDIPLVFLYNKRLRLGQVFQESSWCTGG